MCFRCLWILIITLIMVCFFNAVLTITFLTDQRFTFFNCNFNNQFLHLDEF